jgi:hypothetical protein
MINFQELRITPDGKYLIIDVVIPKYSFYENISIASISIYNKSTYKHPLGLNDPVKVWSPTEEEYVNTYTSNNSNYTEVLVDIEDNYCYMLGDKVKRARLAVPVNSIGGRANIYFVYVETKGEIDESAAGSNYEIIAEEPNIKMGVAVDLQPIYRNTIKYIKEYNKTCCIPTKFIDCIIQFKAFELYLQTGNYVKAIEYFDKYISKLYKDYPDEIPR